jgi:hypothetical protein
MRAILSCLLLSSCGFSQPYVREPHLQTVAVQVAWLTPEQIHQRCGAGAAACSTVNTFDGQMGLIWAQMPRAFDDYERVYQLGHELLHSLGATHE